MMFGSSRGVDDVSDGIGSTTKLIATHRMAWPDVARGLAILLVVLHHSIRWLADEGMIPEYWSVITEFLRTMRMPLFFGVAGLFASSWIGSRSWSDFWSKKFAMLAWIYILWCTIRWASFLFLPRLGVPEPFYLSRLLVAPVWPTNELWFIYALAVFFLLSRLIRKLPILVQVSFVSALSIFAFSEYSLFPNDATEGMASYFLFFLVGMLFREKIFLFASSLSLIIAISIISCWLSIYILAEYLNFSTFVGFPVVIRLLGFASGIAIARAVSIIRYSGWINWIGRHTLQIFVAHVIVIITVINAMIALGAPKSGAWTNYYPLLVAFSGVIFSLIFWRLSILLRMGYLYSQPAWLTNSVERLVSVISSSFRSSSIRGSANE